jgi:hypothetical protein
MELGIALERAFFPFFTFLSNRTKETKERKERLFSLRAREEAHMELSDIINCFDLFAQVERDGVTLSKGIGERKGACPKCGGRDRFGVKHFGGRDYFFAGTATSNAATHSNTCNGRMD